MWLAAVALAVGALGITTLIVRRAGIAVSPDLGWMSEHWLAEHQASNR